MWTCTATTLQCHKLQSNHKMVLWWVSSFCLPPPLPPNPSCPHPPLYCGPTTQGPKANTLRIGSLCFAPPNWSVRDGRPPSTPSNLPSTMHMLRARHPSRACISGFLRKQWLEGFGPARPWTVDDHPSLRAHGRRSGWLLVHRLVCLWVRGSRIGLGSRVRTCAALGLLFVVRF